MRWTNLAMFPGAAPVLLADKWLLRLTADHARTQDTTHGLDVRLIEAMPTQPADFLEIVWRIQTAGALYVHTWASVLATGTPGGPGGPVVALTSVYDHAAVWRTRAGRTRRGVYFQLDVLPVWRPTPKD